MWIAYSTAILYGTGFGWTFICLNTVTGHYYGPGGFSKGKRMMLLACGDFLLAGRFTWAGDCLTVPQL